MRRTMPQHAGQGLARRHPCDSGSSKPCAAHDEPARTSIFSPVENLSPGYLPLSQHAGRYGDAAPLQRCDPATQNAMAINPTGNAAGFSC
jgi:hypothetical protein